MEIRCPKCHEILCREGNSYVCKNRHTYDLAKEGYLNLNEHKSTSGDSDELILARRKFLSKDHYLFLKEEVSKILKEENVSSLIDLACGEGYYTKDFPADEKIGIDLSKKALKLASRSDPSAFYLLTSIFHVPMEDEVCDAITVLFAPLASKEVRRLLKEGGILLYIRPGKRHLYELKKALYEEVYENVLEEIDIEGMRLEKEYSLERKAMMKKEDLLDLFRMTPYSVKTGEEDEKKLQDVTEMEITLSFDICVYRKERSSL